MSIIEVCTFNTGNDTPRLVKKVTPRLTRVTIYFTNTQWKSSADQQNTQTCRLMIFLARNNLMQKHTPGAPYGSTEKLIICVAHVCLLRAKFSGFYNTIPSIQTHTRRHAARSTYYLTKIPLETKQIAFAALEQFHRKVM